MGKTIAIVLVVLGLAACSGYENERGRGDAPVGPIDDDPALIINMPDRYANVAFKCIDHNGMYQVTADGVRPVIIKDDPNCQE